MGREKIFTIGKKKFTAKFPNVGQIIDMESLKQAQTQSRYGQMAMSGIQSQYFALDLVDAISFFQVVVPEVGKYFDITNYTSLSIDKTNDLLKAYTEVIRPWFNETLNELKNLANEGENKDN